MGNLRLALRTLLRTPFVTAIAIGSLALGIGANAAIFSLFDQMLLRSLPVPKSDRLVNLSAPGPKRGSTWCNQAGDCEVVFSYPMFRDLEREQKVFTGLAAHRLFNANVAFEGQVFNSEGLLVSGSYFPVLQLQPAIGRLLTPADDSTIGGHFVTVLSHDFWASRLGADPSVLNRSIVVNGQSLTIVGVAARGFTGTTVGARPDLYVPMTMAAMIQPWFESLESRTAYWAYLFARLRPGVSIEQARTALNAIYRPIINDVEVPLQEEMSDQMMAQFRAKEILLEPGGRGQSSIDREARPPLILMFAVTAIVLLIACANIANLLLARGAGRSMEMAVRLSLGASRWQVLRQLLTESLLLAVLGGVASLLVAQWTLELIASFLPPEAHSTLSFELDSSAVWFAAAVAIATGLIFGIYPALHSTRADLITTMRANTGQPSGARAASRFRTSLVTVQIALAMALLVSAGLFVKSLLKVSRVELGVNVDNVVTFGISPRLNGYDPERARALFGRVEEELAALPGVRAVTASRVPLLAGSTWGTGVAVEGFKADLDTDVSARFNQVGPAYFGTLGVPLLAGREFDQRDALGASKVAVVNETFARKFGLGRAAVGKRMSRDRQGELDLEIVGLVQDAKYSEVKQEVPPLFFTPYRQDSTIGAITFYARTASAPEAVLRAVPAMMARLDPNIPVEELKTMPQQVRENVFLDRMISTFSAAFAGLATLLAAIGLYGVLAYTVAQRTREIGVRMALGADAGAVRAMVLRQVGWMTAIGGAIGIAAAIALGRAARSMLYEMESHDPVVVVLSVLVLVLVALGAGYVPALRASRVDPMQALRYE